VSDNSIFHGIDRKSSGGEKKIPLPNDLTPAVIVFGVLRGKCADPCTCMSFVLGNKDNMVCKTCGHLPAAHENVGNTGKKNSTSKRNSQETENVPQLVRKNSRGSEHSGKSASKESLEVHMLGMLEVLNKSTSKKAKTRFLILSKAGLTYYKNQKSETPKGQVTLGLILHISTEKNPKFDFCFSISTSGFKWILAARSQEEMANWICAIDSLGQKNFGTQMLPLQKRDLLQVLYKTPFKGGKIKCSVMYDEEWEYLPSGSVKNIKGAEGAEFFWNGDSFNNQNEKFPFGNGIWNGVWIQWNVPKQTTVFMKYYWNPATQTFFEAKKNKASLNWKWAANSLVRKKGGLWTVEGEVPFPVVMFLQLLRYYCFGKQAK